MGSSHLVRAMSNINFNQFLYDYGDIYRLVENSHSLYIVYHSILFLISIHTVTHHSNPHSLHLSCLCLLFHITLRYLMVSFFYFSLLTWYILLLFHIPPHHLSNPLQPLSIFLFLLHIKYIKKTDASLFLLVHIGIYHHHTSMSSYHSLSLANILLSPSVSLLPPHSHLQNVNFFGHYFICTYSFSISVSLNPFFQPPLFYYRCASSRSPHSLSSLISPSHSSSLLSTR